MSLSCAVCVGKAGSACLDNFQCVETDSILYVNFKIMEMTTFLNQSNLTDHFFFLFLKYLFTTLYCIGVGDLSVACLLVYSPFTPSGIQCSINFSNKLVF